MEFYYVAGTSLDSGGHKKTHVSPRDTWAGGSVLSEAVCILLVVQ